MIIRIRKSDLYFVLYHILIIFVCFAIGYGIVQIEKMNKSVQTIGSFNDRFPDTTKSADRRVYE